MNQKTTLLIVGAIVLAVAVGLLIYYYNAGKEPTVVSIDYVDDYEIIQKSDGSTVVNPNW